MGVKSSFKGHQKEEGPRSICIDHRTFAFVADSTHRVAIKWKFCRLSFLSTRFVRCLCDRSETLTQMIPRWKQIDPRCSQQASLDRLIHFTGYIQWWKNWRLEWKSWVGCLKLQIFPCEPTYNLSSIRLQCKDLFMIANKPVMLYVMVCKWHE